MAPNSENVLKKAVTLIRGGKMAKARPSLVALLRREPNNAQAWYLLSFTLEDPQKQQYAIQRALLADPDFEKARTRLQALREEGAPASQPALYQDDETVAPPIVVELEKSTPTFVEEPAKAADVGSEFQMSVGDKPRRSRVGRFLIFVFLILLVSALAYAAFNYLPVVSITPASSTPIASRTLPPTWTPTIQPTATATRTPVPTSTPTIAITETPTTP